MAFVPVLQSSFIMAGEAGKQFVVVDCAQGVGDIGGAVVAADFGLLSIDSCYYTNATSADGVQIVYDTSHSKVTLTTSAGDQILLTLIGASSGV